MAAAEEIAFRGALLGLLLRRHRRATAVASSSLLFGLWHLLPTLPAMRRTRSSPAGRSPRTWPSPPPFPPGTGTLRQRGGRRPGRDRPTTPAGPREHGPAAAAHRRPAVSTADPGGGGRIEWSGAGEGELADDVGCGGLLATSGCWPGSRAPRRSTGRWRNGGPVRSGRSCWRWRGPRSATPPTGRPSCTPQTGGGTGRGCGRGYSAGWPAGSGRGRPGAGAAGRGGRRLRGRPEATEAIAADEQTHELVVAGLAQRPAPAPPAGSGRRCSAPTTGWCPTSRWCWAWPGRAPPPGRPPRRPGRPAGRGAVDGRRRAHLGALPAGAAGGRLPGAGRADAAGADRAGGRGAGAGLPGQGDGGRPGRAARRGAGCRRRRPTGGRGRRRRPRRGRHRRGRVGGGGDRVQLRVVGRRGPPSRSCRSS
jgi:hypothetical protein